MTYDTRLIVHAAMGLMRAAPARPLAAVAVQCGVSRDTLARAFRRSGSGSVADLRDRVMHERMNVLMTAVPPKSIKEISDGLGFATPQSFARWVKRQDGVVPRALRDALCRRLDLGQAPAHGAGAPRPAPHETPSGMPLAGGATSSPCTSIAAPGAARRVTYDLATRAGRRLAWLTSRGRTCPSPAAAGAC
jgi:AraC-like DNA-binding protein